MKLQFKITSVKCGNLKKPLLFFLLLFTVCSASLTVKAQKLDNMTDGEDALVRDIQEMDARMDLYVHIIDRRFLALSDANAAQSKQAQKEFNKYGELRVDTRARLFSDIDKTLAEAVGKIDDVAEHDKKNPLFSKSVRILSKACTGWLPQFKSFQEQSSAAQEKATLANSVEQCSEVIEATSKLSKDTPKEEKKKSKSDSN